MDCCRSELLLDCLCHRQLGSECTDSAGALMVEDGYIW